jgi:hypothetical protein
LAEATLGRDQEVVKRSGTDEPIWVVIHLHGNNTRNLPVYLSLSQSSKNVMFFFLFFMLFLRQDWRTRGKNRFCLGPGGQGEGRLAQITYTHISKCKNNKIIF